MNINTVALIFQIAVGILLIINIIHHW